MRLNFLPFSSLQNMDTSRSLISTITMISLVLLTSCRKENLKTVTFFHPEISFIYALQDETTLHFINPRDEARMSLHADAGDLLIWSEQQIHYGAILTTNLRLFGNIRSHHCRRE